MGGMPGMPPMGMPGFPPPGMSDAPQRIEFNADLIRNAAYGWNATTIHGSRRP